MSDISASTLVHRLLFHALTEIRDAGHANGDKLVFHLADLFHHAVLQMASLKLICIVVLTNIHGYRIHT